MLSRSLSHHSIRRPSGPGLTRDPHSSLTIAGVGGETLGVKIEAVMSSRDHGFSASDLGLAYGTGGLDFDDDGMIEVGSWLRRRRTLSRHLPQSTARPDRPAQNTSA
jgi:hypothetical protein